MDRARQSDPPASSTSSSRLEDLLALAVALLAEERCVSAIRRARDVDHGEARPCTLTDRPQCFARL